MAFKIIRNDLTKVAADAIVNTANPRPVCGDGTDRAVYEAAGKEKLLEERKKIGNLEVGQAAATPAFALPAKYIIHTVGPVWWGGGNGEREDLRRCYMNSLNLALKLGCESIAFPMISTGVYGFPKAEALQIAVSAFSEFLTREEMEIILVVFGQESFELSGKLFSRIESYIDENYVAEKSAREYTEDTEYTGYTGKVNLQARNTAFSRPAAASDFHLESEEKRERNTFARKIREKIWGKKSGKELSELSAPGMGMPAEKSQGRPPEERPAMPSEKSSDRPSEKSSDRPSEKSSDRPVEMGSARPSEKSSDRPPEKSSDRPAEMGSARPSDLELGEPVSPDLSGRDDLNSGKLNWKPSKSSEFSEDISMASGRKEAFQPDELKEPSYPVEMEEASGPYESKEASIRDESESSYPLDFGDTVWPEASKEPRWPDEADKASDRADKVSYAAEPPKEIRESGKSASYRSPANFFKKEERRKKRSLDEIVKQVGYTWQEQLFLLIDQKGFTDLEVYKRANIDRKLFSKIRGNVSYQPKKITAVAFALALELNLDETRDFLGRAGYAFSPSSVFDLIVAYFIENHVYDTYTINLALFDHNQPLLGA